MLRNEVLDSPRFSSITFPWSRYALSLPTSCIDKVYLFVRVPGKTPNTPLGVNVWGHRDQYTLPVASASIHPPLPTLRLRQGMKGLLTCSEGIAPGGWGDCALNRPVWTRMPPWCGRRGRNTPPPAYARLLRCLAPRATAMAFSAQRCKRSTSSNTSIGTS